MCVHSCLRCLKWAVSQNWSWQRSTALVFAVWAWLGLALGLMNSWRAAWWCCPIRVNYTSSLCLPSKWWSTILAYEEKTWAESHPVCSPNMAKVGNAHFYTHHAFAESPLKRFVWSSFRFLSDVPFRVWAVFSLHPFGGGAALSGWGSPPDEAQEPIQSRPQGPAGWSTYWTQVCVCVCVCVVVV